MRTGLIAGFLCYLTSATVAFQAAAGAAVTNSDPAISALIRQLDSAEESNRLAAARALIKIGPSVAGEVNRAVSIIRGKSANPALNAFVAAGSDAVPIMLALVREENTGLLHDNSGITGLARMGSNAIPGLELTLQDRDPEIRGATIDVLRIMSQEPEIRMVIARLLIRTTKDEKDDRLRVYAIDALGFFGIAHPAPEVVCRTLHELLVDPLEKARFTAAYSLAKACPKSAAEAIPMIVKAISSNDKELAWESAFALQFVGTNAVSVLPELGQALGHVDFRTAGELLGVIAKIGDPAFPVLRHAYTNAARSDLRIAVMASFGEFSTLTKTNLPQTISFLSQALKDNDRDIRAAAVNSLKNAAVERKEPELSKLISTKLRSLQDDKDQWIRDDVKRGLEEINSINKNSK